jgi:hypothetical protein
MYAQDMGGPLSDYKDDIITKPFKIEKGYLRVPEGPGLGVELDEEKLAQWARYKKELKPQDREHLIQRFGEENCKTPYNFPPRY